MRLLALGSFISDYTSLWPWYLLAFLSQVRVKTFASFANGCDGSSCLLGNACRAATSVRCAAGTANSLRRRVPLYRSANSRHTQSRVYHRLFGFISQIQHHNNTATVPPIGPHTDGSRISLE